MSRNAHQSRGRSSPPSDEGRINDEERPSKRHKETHPQELSRFKEVGLMRNGMGRASASFIGSASGIHFIRSVYSAMAGRTSHPHGEDPESNLVPGEDDRLDSGWGNSRYLQIWQPHEVNLANDPLKETFTFDDLVHWSGSYFDLWHPAYPFLHAPSILESFERFAQNGLPRENTYDSILIRAIISISLCDRRQRNDPFPRPVPKCLVFTTFEDALESIQPAVTNAATISALQAVVSVQLLEVSMLRLKSASRLGGLVIRLAFQMGLHRCPSRFVAFSLAERQLRQRLFWSIYCIDRHLCQALGLPLTVRDDDIDVCYPDQERHILPAANPQQHAGARKREQQADSRLMILALLARHAEIKGCIMELRNKMVSSREESLERAVFVNSRLTQWWNQVEDAIEQAEYQGAPFNVLHKAIFTVLKHESKIALNRPLLTTSKKTASYAGALHSCIAASKAIISTLHALVAPVNDTISLSPGQNQKVYQPMFWPSFTWAVWMSAFIMLYAAMENEVDSHIAMRSTDRSLQILEKLGSRGSIWPSACAIAIRDMRTGLSQPDQSSETNRNPPSSSNHSDSGIVARQPETTAPTSHSNDTNYFAEEETDTSSSQHAGWVMPYATTQPPTPPPQPQQRAKLNQYSTFTPSPTTMPATQPSRAGGLMDMQNPQTYAEPVGSGSGQYTQQYSAGMHSNVFPETMSTKPWPDFASIELGSVSEMPPISLDGLDPLQGFDIPFWIGHDNTAAWMNNG